MINFLILILISTASGIQIKCDYNNEDFSIIGRVYACRVISVEFYDDSIKLTNVEGKHLIGYSSDDVEVILFENCENFNISMIPKGFLENFPNLIGLKFDYCSINFLNGDELAEYPQLQYFEYHGEKLNRIPENFFASTPNMKIIHFKDSQITNVGRGLLDNLWKLQEVSFTLKCIQGTAQKAWQITELRNELTQNCFDVYTENLILEVESNKNLIANMTEVQRDLAVYNEELKAENLKLKKENSELLKHKDHNLKLMEENLKHREKNQKFDEILLKLSTFESKLDTSIKSERSSDAPKVQQKEINLISHMDSSLHDLKGVKVAVEKFFSSKLEKFESMLDNINTQVSTMKDELLIKIDKNCKRNSSSLRSDEHVYDEIEDDDYDYAYND